MQLVLNEQNKSGKERNAKFSKVFSSYKIITYNY